MEAVAVAWRDTWREAFHDVPGGEPSDHTHSRFSVEHNPTVVVLEEIATPGIPASRLFEAPASKGEQGCYLSFVLAHPKFTGLDCIEKICYSLTALDE